MGTLTDTACQRAPRRHLRYQRSWQPVSRALRLTAPRPPKRGRRGRRPG